MLIAEASFVVVDLETTGLSPTLHRITEVAMLRVERGVIIERYESLVNPEQYIPPFITEHTGISNAMVYGKPTFAELAPKIASWIGQSSLPIIVGHNVQFDKGFLLESFKRSKHEYPVAKDFGELPTLCTFRLAKRLITKIEKRSLKHVADYFGIKIKARHRAMGDAEATAKILIEFLKMADEFGCEEASDVLKLQFRKPEPVKRTSIQRTLQAQVKEFPQRPGVYTMRDTRGHAIYVGKAKDLRDRVSSYFTNTTIASGTKLQRMMKAVRKIEYQETGSELSALLAESQRIKELKPQFNTLERRYKSWSFLKLDVQNLFPKLQAVREPAIDGAEYYGPFRSRSGVEALIEVLNRSFTLRECADPMKVSETNKPCFYYDIGRCKAPCAKLETPKEYRSEVDRFRDFLASGEAGILALVERMMMDASDRLEFEEAQYLKLRYKELKKVLGTGERQVSSLNANNCVLLTPVAGERVELFFIRFGRLVKQITLGQENLEGADKWFAKQLRLYYAAGSSALPPACGKPEIDEMRILAQWVERAKNDDESKIVYIEDSQTEACKKLVETLNAQLGMPPIAREITLDILDLPANSSSSRTVASISAQAITSARKLTVKPMYPKR